MSDFNVGTVLKDVRLTDLDQFALFDRIINVMFERAKSPPFVIRSDYEVAFDANKKPYFIPIKQKPGIKVTYKQVANSVAIEVGVEVAGLYFTTEKAGDSIFEAEENPVTDMIIQMGYRNQFPNWTQPPLNADGEDEAADINRLKMFYAMDNFTIRGKQELMDTGLQLKVQVLSAYPEGNPPDRVVHFQGVVANLSYGLVW
jgi:hypothetical protein